MMPNFNFKPAPMPVPPRVLPDNANLAAGAAPEHVPSEKAPEHAPPPKFETPVADSMDEVDSLRGVAKRFETALGKVMQKKGTAEEAAENLEYVVQEAMRKSSAGDVAKVSTGYSGCPLSFGEDSDGRVIGPWFKASDEEAIAAEHAAKDDVTRHKVMNPKTRKRDAHLVTTEGVRCIQDDPNDLKYRQGTFMKGVLEKLRLLQSVMEHSTKHKQRRRGEINGRISRMASRVADIKSRQKYGNRVLFKSTKDNKCDPLHLNDEMWKDIVGTPQNPKHGILPTDSELTRDAWERGFGVAMDDGKHVMCLNPNDSLIDKLSSMDYHNIAELRDVYDEDDGSYPVDEHGIKIPMDEVYMTSAFCAQRHTKDECHSTNPTQFPGASKPVAPNDKCEMYEPRFETGEGVCRPKFVADQYVDGVSPPGGLPDNKMGRFYDAFRRAEKEIQTKVYNKNSALGVTPGGGAVPGRWKNSTAAIDMLKSMISK